MKFIVLDVYLIIKSNLYFKYLNTLKIYAYEKNCNFRVGTLTLNYQSASTQIKTILFKYRNIICNNYKKKSFILKQISYITSITNIELNLIH